MSLRYLIIGNGVAGTTAAETIRQRDPEGEISLLTEEDLPFYRRIMLNEYLAGALAETGLVVHNQEWYDRLRLKLLTSTRVVEAPADRAEIITDTGLVLPYDRLLLATGSHSFLPPVPGNDRPGVHTLRNIHDARQINTCCSPGGQAVLVGGGLLGLETGQALLQRGMTVTVVEMSPRLLPHQLDDKGAARLQSLLTARGFAFRIGASLKEITGSPAVTGAVLASGEVLPAGLVIFSAGVRPNLELAHCLGLECDRGIIVDAMMRTSRENVFAAGDVTEFCGVCYGIWPPAQQQGEAAGIAMTGGDPHYQGSAPATRLKVTGIELAAAGDIDADHRHQSHLEESASVYRKFVVNDQGQLIGFIMLGDAHDFAAKSRMVAEKAPFAPPTK
jgi:nitrite reductase (NADH) large subunit